jgi:tetratricopeptide (TPR) repeat protein
MRLPAVSLVVGVFALASVIPATAQLRASRPARPVQNLPRFMVANPHSFATADSAAAVRVGTGMRDKMESIADKWYNVILRNQMNDALVQYGYPPDAVLPPLVARQLASQLQARALVTSTLTRGDGGAKVSIESRLTGIGDQTGFILKMEQAPNQSFEDLGDKIAEGLKGALGALQDAKQCESLRTTDAAKAADAAQKALKQQPNFGLAEMCLANIAVAKKAPADEVIGHFVNATKGDRMSLEAWGGLLGQYQQKNDTAHIVSTYEALIQLAPNNQKVVEEAVRYFIIAGVPNRGEQIASDAIKQDPSNPSNYLLLARACLVQGATKPEKNKCAVGALEQMFALDSAASDTFNLQAMIYASSREPVDTARYIKWSQFAAKKFPKNATLLGELVKAYSVAGPLDSLVAVTKRVVSADTTDMSPVIRAMKALDKEKRYKESIELVQFIDKYGSPTDKQNAGVIIAQEIGLEMLKTQPVDYAALVDVGKRSVTLVPQTGRASQLANYIIGIGMLGQIGDKDTKAVQSKQCEDVNALETWINDTKAALTIGKPIQDAFITEQLTKLESYGTRIGQMKKAYCK